MQVSHSVIRRYSLICNPSSFFSVKESTENSIYLLRNKQQKSLVWDCLSYCLEFSLQEAQVLCKLL